MDIRFTPVAGFTRPRWTPFMAPPETMALGQAAPPPQTAPAPAPVPAPAPAAPPPVPFIDSAFFSFLFDGAIAVAGAITGNRYWQTAKKKTEPGKKAAEKRKAYFFYGLAGVAAIKGVFDSGRIMR